jgi:hypothetical protein
MAYIYGLGAYFLVGDEEKGQSLDMFLLEGDELIDLAS